jgi:hypothetical protein
VLDAITGREGTNNYKASFSKDTKSRVVSPKNPTTSAHSRRATILKDHGAPTFSGIRQHYNNQDKKPNSDAQLQSLPLAPLSELHVFDAQHEGQHERDSNAASSLRPLVPRQRSASMSSPLPTSMLDPHTQTENTSHDSAPPAMVTARERMGGYLQTRDMRNLVMPFSPKNTPSLIVRRHVVLLNIDPMRGVVLRDRLLILVPDGADSILSKCESRLRGGVREMEKQAFGDSIEDDTTTGSVTVADSSSGHGGNIFASLKSGQELLQKHTSMDSDVSVDPSSHQRHHLHLGKNKLNPYAVASQSALGIDRGILNVHNAIHGVDPDAPLGAFPEVQVQAGILDEFDDINQRNFLKECPFELHAIDVIMDSATSMLLGETWIVCDDARDVIRVLCGQDTSVRQSHHHHEALRLLRNEATEMKTRLQGFSKALYEVLNDDEDLALMNLSRLVTHPERFILPISQEVLNEESDEPELILESYQQQVQSALNSLNLVIEQMETVRAHVEFELDSIQNRLIFIETVLNAVTLVLTIGSAVGCFLGMNVSADAETGLSLDFGDKEGAFVNTMAVTLVGCAFLCIFIYVSVLQLSRRLL